MKTPRRSNGTERQSDRDTEKHSNRDFEDTDVSDEVPPLAARVTSLPEAVQLSLQPTYTDKSLFIFVRALKAFEITVSRVLPKAELENAFSMWWNAAKAFLPPDSDFDEWRFAFLDTFAKTHSPLGSNHLEEAIRRARSNPPRQYAGLYGSPKLMLLLAVCYHLQTLVGYAYIFVSARDAGAIMQMSPFRALQVLNGFVEDGVLIAGELGRPGGRRANRYWFNAPEFDPPSKK